MMKDPTDTTPGASVFVKAFGHWYPGTVDRLTKTKIHVTYTSGSGKTRTKPARPDEVSTERGEERRPGRQQNATVH